MDDLKMTAGSWLNPTGELMTLPVKLASQFVAAVVCLFAMNSPGQAQSCGGQYAIVPGDSLSLIADRVYQDATLWTAIYYLNQQTLGTDPSLIYPDMQINIPCLDDSERSAARVTATQSAPASGSSATLPMGQVQFVTAGDYAPFTDPELPNGGVFTDLVAAAFEKQRGQQNGPQASISWVNDWAAHLKPLVLENKFDAGFPWFRPECEASTNLDDDAKFRCDNFKFSEPVFQLLILVFVKRDSTFQFTSDADILGKNICRPTGYFVFDFDQDGRNWLAEQKITLTRPSTVAECFELLDQGKVDAVSLNEFTGKDSIRDLDLGDKVVAAERPLSVIGLHVLTSKSHPHRDKLIEYVNNAMNALRDSGEYDAIVEKHMAKYWKLN